jgi:hypothetical protein
MLCDMGAAELLFPLPWFSAAAATVSGAASLVELANAYNASREATMGRYVEASPESAAVTFFVWKLKPTQKGVVGREEQGNLFGITAAHDCLTTGTLPHSSPGCGCCVYRGGRRARLRRRSDFIHVRHHLRLLRVVGAVFNWV